MRILLFGGSGQVGEELRALAMPVDVEVVAPSRSALDLQDADAVARMIAAESWSVVVNAAAYTEVDRAENAAAGGVAADCADPPPTRAAAATPRLSATHIPHPH